MDTTQTEPYVVKQIFQIQPSVKAEEIKKRLKTKDNEPDIVYVNFREKIFFLFFLE